MKRKRERHESPDEPWNAKGEQLLCGLEGEDRPCEGARDQHDRQAGHADLLHLANGLTGLQTPEHHPAERGEQEEDEASRLVQEPQYDATDPFKYRGAGHWGAKYLPHAGGVSLRISPRFMTTSAALHFIWR